MIPTGTRSQAPPAPELPGKKVFLTDWTAPSTGRFHIAVGSEGNDRTGMYWLSIIKDATN